MKYLLILFLFFTSCTPPDNIKGDSEYIHKMFPTYKIVDKIYQFTGSYYIIQDTINNKVYHIGLGHFEDGSITINALTEHGIGK